MPIKARLKLAIRLPPSTEHAHAMRIGCIGGYFYNQDTKFLPT